MLGKWSLLVMALKGVALNESQINPWRRVSPACEHEVWRTVAGWFVNRLGSSSESIFNSARKHARRNCVGRMLTMVTPQRAIGVASAGVAQQMATVMMFRFFHVLPGLLRLFQGHDRAITILLERNKPLCPDLHQVAWVYPSIR
jgi:hypothetical protein